MCIMEPIPRTGIYTPIVPVGMAPGQLIMDMAPTKHPGLHVANISPPLENVYIQRSSVRNDL